VHPYLATRRRVLQVTYQRYLEAERAWNEATSEMKAWFPTANQPSCLMIGSPGSPIRRLYQQRERAVRQLEVARLKLEVARQRLVGQHQISDAPHILFLCTPITD
jgi:hypothetical protein